jgi:hypothetical protein
VFGKITILSKGTIMKNVIITATLALTAATSFARGGDTARIPSRLSQAGILLEASEHAVRSLIVTGTAESAIESVESSVVEQGYKVLVGLDAGTVVTFTCSLMDELSHGGTVLKKEVRCFKQ